MQSKIMNPQILEQQQQPIYYSNGAQSHPTALYLESQKQQQLSQHLQIQQQQNSNSSQPQQRFQPTHRRSRPLSILYKPLPVLTTEPEHV